jgi:tetratricopeptide (TPR) repeat protein
MSPERATGSGDVDGRSDLYSLGCVLYEMVAGEPPRFGSTPPPGVPAWLGATLARSLAPSPSDRFQSGADFRRALEEGERGGGAVGLRGRTRRSMRRRLALGGAAIAAVALAGIAVRRLPAPPPVAPDRVLIASFDNQTGDPTLDPLGEMAADHLFRGLTATGFVRVVDARNERKNVGSPRELASELGAGSLVGGRYYRAGDSLVFETQIVDAASGVARCSTGRAASPLGEASRGVALAQQRVMACFAKLFDPAFVKYEGSNPPPSYEAYLELRAGDETFFQRCDACPWQAMEHVERAIAIDSTYTAAWTSLAAMSVLMGDCHRAAQISERLDPVRDELPPYDRAQLEVSLAACRGAWVAALDAAKRGALAEPHRAGITGWIPLFALILNRPRDALEVIASSGWTPLLGEANPFGWQMGAAYHMLGDHETELKTARLARYASPDDMFTLQNEIVALAALGRAMEVETRIEELLAHPAEQSSMESPGSLMVRAGLELRAHGHAEEARTVFERAVEWHRDHPLDARDPESLVVAGPWRGQALDLTGRWDEERELLEWILQSSPTDVPTRGALGALAARRGDRRGAAEADAWLARRWAESSEGGARAVISYERASSAALLGENQRALDLLRRAIGEGYAFVSADYTYPLDVDRDLDSLRDDSAFQRLVEPKG